MLINKLAAEIIPAKTMTVLSIVLGGILIALHQSQAYDKVEFPSTTTQTGHYLEYKAKPLLLLGDSVTQGWFECGTNFNYRNYIDALAKRRINVLMLWSYIGTNAIQQTQDERIGYDSPEVWPWYGSPDRGDFDLTRLNPAYFDRLKGLVAYAASKKIIVLISVHDGWTKDRFACHPFNSSNGNGPLTRKSQYVELADYGREMPATYKASWTRKQKNQYFQESFCNRLISELNPYANVIYEMFNEGAWYESAQRYQHEQHFLRYFRARCHNLLMTNTDHISGDDPHKDSKVDIISLHGSWENRFGVWQLGFDRKPPKPYFCSEPVPGWFGNEDFLGVIRRSLWEAALGGAGWVNQNDSSFGWDPHTIMAEKAAERDQAYDYVGNCIRLLSKEIDLAEMKPKGNLTSTGIAMADEGEKYLIYIPTGGKFTVDLSKASGRLDLKWYNPIDGKFSKCQSVKGGALRTFESPNRQDWILYICCSN